MGRPLNSKHFGTGTGDQIKVRAKIGSNAEGDGFIVKQTGTNRYIVTVGANTGVCVMVDKANGSLLAGEMSVSVKDEAGNVKQVKNIKGHSLVLDTGEIAAWKYGAASAAAVQIADEAGVLASTITITGQPTNQTASAGAATFTVTATVDGGATLSYQWQVRTGGAGSYANVAGATSASYAITGATSALNGNQYRCVVSATNGATSKTSNSATLTAA